MIAGRDVQRALMQTNCLINEQMDILNRWVLEQTFQCHGIIPLENLRSHIDQHGSTDVLEQGNILRVGKDRIPQHKHIVQMELPSQHQTDPRQRVELRLDFELVKMCLQLRILGFEDLVLNTTTGLHHRRDIALVFAGEMQELNGVAVAALGAKKVTDTVHHTVEDPEGVVLQVLGREELEHLCTAEECVRIVLLGRFLLCGVTLLDELTVQYVEYDGQQFVHALLVDDIGRDLGVHEQDALLQTTDSWLLKVLTLGEGAHHIGVNGSLQFLIAEETIPCAILGL
mmetsp:Transcript_52637/g.132389  ORF Transcript_52637/g.132389 Transcript_52637/m.132389 type:complete len:285 (-) Transcript_52637:493-1347(-)